MTEKKPRSFIDGSRLIIEAAVQAGGDVFVGYPITPANLLYLYSSQRFPEVLPAPDEITTLQWMAGFSAAGRIPVTATSFPGLALMTESIGMSFMMELPMVIMLAQRLGPSTGTATCGAQGDINVINGLNSGGYPIPTLCISDLDDCWRLSAEAVRLAVELSSPVILLTSKEIIMTMQDYDMTSLPPIKKVEPRPFEGEVYLPYEADVMGLRTHVPVGDERHRVRLTASTHDETGELQHTTKPAMDNTRRLLGKMIANLHTYTHFTLDEEKSDTIILAYDITAAAAKEAVARLRAKGRKVSLLIAKTLFPVPPDYTAICSKYKNVIIPEENINGLYRKVLYGEAGKPGVVGINAVGRMITPDEIIETVDGINKPKGTAL